jgi:hypothetical protein
LGNGITNSTLGARRQLNRRGFERAGGGGRFRTGEAVRAIFANARRSALTHPNGTNLIRRGRSKGVSVVRCRESAKGDRGGVR